MVAKIARGAFLVFLAGTIVAWAMSVGKSSPAEPRQELPTDRMYS
jgi:hypothetical protein